jgi:phosphate transport system substrate-binding protein
VREVNVMRKSFWISSILLLIFLASMACAEEVLVKGSDTLLNLVQQLAEAYMKENPEAEISVVGGGSGVGIAALIDGNVDIANASRGIKETEISKAKENGINPAEIVIAIDGLAVIINPKNNVDKLTVEQLGQIYRGDIVNWKGVGGPDMRINLYGRQPSSGTFVFFREHVLKGDYSPRMRQMAGNAQIVEGVKRDESGVGYVGLGYIKGTKGVKVVKIGKREKDKPIEYVTPEIFIKPLKPGQKKPEPDMYTLTRPLFQYINGIPKGSAKAFIEFELSEKGQKIVEEVGFLAASKKQQEKNRSLLGN